MSNVIPIEDLLRNAYAYDGANICVEGQFVASRFATLLCALRDTLGVTPANQAPVS